MVKCSGWNFLCWSQISSNISGVESGSDIEISNPDKCLKLTCLQDWHTLENHTERSLKSTFYLHFQAYAIRYVTKMSKFHRSDPNQSISYWAISIQNFPISNVLRLTSANTGFIIHTHSSAVTAVNIWYQDSWKPMLVSTGPVLIKYQMPPNSSMRERHSCAEIFWVYSKVLCLILRHVYLTHRSTYVILTQSEAFELDISVSRSLRPK